MKDSCLIRFSCVSGIKNNTARRVGLVCFFPLLCAINLTFRWLSMAVALSYIMLAEPCWATFRNMMQRWDVPYSPASGERAKKE